MKIDHDQAFRQDADDSAPEQERLVTPQEEADQDLAQLDDPPQAEGDRESAGEASRG